MLDESCKQDLQPCKLKVSATATATAKAKATATVTATAAAEASAAISTVTAAVYSQGFLRFLGAFSLYAWAELVLSS